MMGHSSFIRLDYQFASRETGHSPSPSVRRSRLGPSLLRSRAAAGAGDQSGVPPGGHDVRPFSVRCLRKTRSIPHPASRTCPSGTATRSCSRRRRCVHAPSGSPQLSLLTHEDRLKAGALRSSNPW